MTRKRARGLRPEERRLWESYSEGMRPRLPGRDDTSEKNPPASAQDPGPTARPPEPAPLPAFRVGEAARGKGSVAVTSAAPAWERPVRMDGKAHGKMKKGRLRPDARIDLHGMNVEEAHGALISFILSRQAQGARLVLVITGKGSAGDGPAPVERGVLRRQVPHWLQLPPLGTAVLDIAPAHRRHGGDGAYYVYLRRLR